MEKNIEEIINVSDYLYNNKLVAGKAGNVSARFKGEDGDVIAITPTLKSLYGLNEEDIVLVDLEGNLLTSSLVVVIGIFVCFLAINIVMDIIRQKKNN